MDPLTTILAKSLLGASPLGDDLPLDPMPLFKTWFDEAVASLGKEAGPAMALATVGADAQPSVRMVLCKGISIAPPAIRFFTNFESRKSREIIANPQVSAVFHWASTARQVRIEGTAAKVPAADSDAYFRTRPLLSKLGAWASQQSTPLATRADLVGAVAQAASRFGVVAALTSLAQSDSDAIPRPPHWGGYEISIHGMELWTNISGRLHDRARWTFNPAQGWSAQRLQP
jgi:pyridoxamine 5'-phosphate oxidase